MRFIPKAPKGAVKVRFIDGPLSRFDGKALSVGIAAKAPLPRRKFVLLMRKAVHLAKQNRAGIIAIDFKDLKKLAPKDFSNFEVGKVTGSAFVMADYEHTTYKKAPKEGWPVIKTAAITNTPEDGKEGFWTGQMIGDGVNSCRELSNMPGGDMTPKVLAAAAKTAVKGTKVSIKVLGRKDMEKLGMGAVLGIAKGSAEEPQFIVMEYKGGPSTGSGSKPVVLVGKGVTFDTGGLNLKPGDHMYEMHMDMSGGAAVIGAVAVAAKLGIKTNVIGLVPAVENNPGQHAVRPGDILKSLSGKTIEVLNTDAEGRVILADAITYAKRYDPAIVVDVATLTGAALIALGQQASAFMTNTDSLIPQVNEWAEASGDYMWALPMWEEYDDMTRGQFADVPNISTAGNSRYGGVIAGGKFLEVFAKELGCPWVHIDMAPRMTSVPGEFLAKGAAGAPVRFLLQLVEAYAADSKNPRIRRAA